jgi:hypothetical protein
LEANETLTLLDSTGLSLELLDDLRWSMFPACHPRVADDADGATTLLNSIGLCLKFDVLRWLAFMTRVAGLTLLPWWLSTSELSWLAWGSD